MDDSGSVRGGLDPAAANQEGGQVVLSEQKYESEEQQALILKS